MKILYVVARTDLASLNPGKLAAQVAHAASQCAYYVNNIANNPVVKGAYTFWEQQAEGFGTTIVLDGGNIDQFNEAYRKIAMGTRDFTVPYICGVVNDPTYPVKDGSFTHLIPIDTCFWVFGEKNNLGYGADEVIGAMKLHK